MKNKTNTTPLVLFIFLALSLPFPAAAIAMMGSDDTSYETKSPAAMGKAVYERYCVGCHGVMGDGKGKGARLMVDKPRNFTTAVFEYKSTPTGSLPTDDDLMRAITVGLPPSSMPSYMLVPVQERHAVIEYIKTFSDRWLVEKPGAPVRVPEVPEAFGAIESVARGETLYNERGCNLCHGAGDGMGPIASAMINAEGFIEQPRNFMRGLYSGGSAPEEIYGTILTGMEGTPMPAFEGAFTEGELWDLVGYLISLKRKP